MGTAFRAVCRKGIYSYTQELNQIDFINHFLSIHQSVQKPGECPTVENSTRCDQECYTDADCRSDNKCCYSGCGYICIHPAEPQITYAPPPVQPQRPAVVYPGAVELEPKSQKEIDVLQPEGDVATLRCFATGYPAPTVTWKRGTIIVCFVWHQNLFHLTFIVQFYVDKYKSRTLCCHIYW